MKHRDCFIGYDLGTSGVKTALIDSDGRLLHSEFASYQTRSRNPGWHEQDPNEWWSAIVGTTRRTMRASKILPRDVQAISFGVQAVGTIPVDKEARALLPCMTWLDARSVDQAKRINEAMGDNLLAKDYAPKALWIKENRSDVFQKAHKIVECGGYLIAKFSGKFVMPGDVSQFAGFDGESRKWKYEPVVQAGDKLPEPAGPTEIVGETTSRAARELGLRPGIPVVAGGSDFAAAVIGSGAIKRRRAHVYLGSSAWIAVIAEKPVTMPAGAGGPGMIFPIPFLDRWIIGGETESACACLNWFQDELAKDLTDKAKRSGRTPHEMLDRMAEKVEPGSSDLLFVPWMKGERAPVKDDFARGAFMGLTLAHRREHLVRAVMEGVACNVRWILDQIEAFDLGFRVESLRGIGGGFKSKIWTQIFADVMGMRMQAVKWPRHAGAIGAALFAATGLGVYKNLDDLDGLLPIAFEGAPVQERRHAYERLATNFKNTYPSEISEIYHEWGARLAQGEPARRGADPSQAQ